MMKRKNEQANSKKNFTSVKLFTKQKSAMYTDVAYNIVYS